MARVNVNECVFLEKYNVAPAPSRDYYGVRIAGNSLLLFIWKIARNHASFPTVRTELLDDYVSNTSMQNEISRLFGEELLSRTMAIARGDKDYLPNLPTNILHAILVNVELRDIASVARTCRKLAEVSKSNGLWQQLYLKYSIGAVPVDQRNRAKNIGWKKYFRANLHKTTVRNRTSGSAQKLAVPPVKEKDHKTSPRTIPAVNLGSRKDVQVRSDRNILKSNEKLIKLDKMSSDSNNKQLVKSEITALKASETRVSDLVGSETKLTTPRSDIRSFKREVKDSKLGSGRKAPVDVVGEIETVERVGEAECTSLAREIKHTLEEITRPKVENTSLNTDRRILSATNKTKHTLEGITRPKVGNTSLNTDRRLLSASNITKHSLEEITRPKVENTSLNTDRRILSATNNHSATQLTVTRNNYSDLTNGRRRLLSSTIRQTQPERKTTILENRFGKQPDLSEKSPETKLTKSRCDINTSGSRLHSSTMKQTEPERKTSTAVLENRFLTANRNLTNGSNPGFSIRSSEMKTNNADKINTTHTNSAVKGIKLDITGIHDRKQNMSVPKISKPLQRGSSKSIPFVVNSKLDNIETKVNKTVRKCESGVAKIVNKSANLSLKAGSKLMSKSERKPVKTESTPNKPRSGLTRTERLTTTTGSKLTKTSVIKTDRKQLNKSGRKP